jgi:hypothetical protein
MSSVMLWSLLKGLGGNGADYSLEEMSDDRLRPEPHMVDLDEIPADLCGHFRARRLAKDLESNNIVFTMAALALVSTLSVFLAMVQPPNFTSGPDTSARWSRHVGQLLCAGAFCVVLVQ